jgi:uncharacterized membrane protein (DUF106 family)
MGLPATSMAASILDPVFSPLLTLPSWLAIIIISAVITTLTTIAYKYLTDQDKMKKLRKEMKAYQKKIKELTKEDPKKAMKVQKEMMEKNMELMKQSFKPTLYTLIPLLIIFGWLNAHMAYDPLLPNEPFMVDVEFAEGTVGEVNLESVPPLQIHKNDNFTKEVEDAHAQWILKGDAGEYNLAIEHESGAAITKEVIISSKTGDYAAPLVKLKEKPFKTLTISNDKIRPLEGLSLVGNWGWIGIYILFSIALSFELRKAMGLS